MFVSKSIQKYHFCDNEPLFKSTITVKEATTNSSTVAKPHTHSNNKWRRRFKRCLFIGCGIGLLYYFAYRKLQQALDDMDPNDIAMIYAEGINQGFVWYYKHLALGMLRQDSDVLNRFNCSQPNELLIVQSYTEQTLQDMLDPKHGCMEIKFQITNKDHQMFGKVRMKLTPNAKSDDGRIGNFMMKDLDGNNNELHICLSVTVDDDEMTVFDKVLTGNDYDVNTIRQWFEDDEIETCVDID